MDGRALTVAGASADRAAVWVTRALPAAWATGARVAALGFAAIVEPAIAVHALPFDPAVAEGAVALAFTSAAGVRAFAAACAARDLPVFAVGAATAAAALACGYARVRSAGGDVAALDRMLAAEAPPGRVLAPGALRPAGRLDRAERLAVYETAALAGPWPEPTAAATAGRLAAVLVQSSSAAVALTRAAIAPELVDVPWLAASPACARPLIDAGLADVRIAAAPRESLLLRLLPALAARPPWQAAPPPL